MEHPAPMDPEYLQRLAHRMDLLQKRVRGMQRSLSHAQDRIRRSNLDLATEFARLKKETHETEAVVEHTIARLKGAIKKFQIVVKKGDVQRLQSRLDAWAPEKNVGRPVFRRMLR